MAHHRQAHGVLQRFGLALVAGDSDDGAFCDYLLLSGDPAGVGDGATGEDTYVGCAEHVEVGERGDDASLAIPLFFWQ
jgi:hypothetical protein